MKNYIVFVILSFTTVSTVLANGGPFETSPVFGAGDWAPVEFVQRDVELVSEELVFTPKINFVEVDVTYILYNYGEDLETGFCFPVTAMIIPEEDRYTRAFELEHDVQGFCISQDGRDLPVEFLLAEESNSTVMDYGHGTPVGTHLFTTQLAIAAGDTTEITVNYLLRATYEDFEVTKHFLLTYQDRRFRYDLRPAAWWGDGTAGTFTMTVNAEELHSMDGSMQILPEGGEWLDDNHYIISEENLNLESLSELSFSFESRTAASSVFLEEHRISPDNYTITVSSELGADYGSDNLSDNDFSTAWAEGEEGTTGSWILVEFDPGTYISWVGLVPGYAKSEYTYTANARPIRAMVAVEIQGTTPFPYTFRIHEIDWEIIEKGFSSKAFWQAYNRGESFDVRSIKITFTETTPGNEFADLCISELVVAAF